MTSRSLGQRGRLTLLMALLGAVVGLVGGYLIWRAITLQLAVDELDRHAWRYMLRAEDSSANSERFLNTMAASHFAPCSDAEIAFMHQL